MVPKVAIWLTACGAVLVAHVLDDLVAVVLAEVDVEVGHRHALRVQEALEQQRVGKRIEVGDAQREGHQRARARAAARADRHAVGLGPVDEVGHDQEVAREAHLDDGVALVGEPRLVLLAPRLALLRMREQLGHAQHEPFAGLDAQEVVQRDTLGRGELRQARLAQGQRCTRAPRGHGTRRGR
jgi:hypothetical protein